MQHRPVASNGRQSTTMHLKPYPKFQKKDLPLETSPDSLRGLHLSQQGALRTERCSNACVTRQPCSPGGLHGNSTAKRRLFGVLSTNTMCNSTSSAGHKPSGESLCARARKSRTASLNSITGSLLLLSTSSENDDSFNIHRGDEAEGPLDIWAVIKPGNTKEKIAIFAASSNNSSSAGSGNRNLSSSISVSISNGSNSSSPSNRTVSMKIKGSWEVEGSVAKRRKRSADPDTLKTPEQKPLPLPNRTRDCGVREVGEQSDSVVIEGEGGEEETEEEEDGDGEGGKALSVVEMVAYLEQRASDLLTDCSKHCPVRGSSCVGQSKGGTAVEQQSVSESQGDCVRVLEMVAKLESECLKRQCEREASTGLSRNNSLRRNVGRVLLATGQVPLLSTQQQQPESEPQHPPHLQQGQNCLLEEESPDKSSRRSPKKNGDNCETPASETASSVFREREGSYCCVDLTEPLHLHCRPKGCSKEDREQQGERRMRGKEGSAGESSCVMEGDSGARAGLQQERREEYEPHVSHREEQIPGMLFFRQPPSLTVQAQLSQPPAAAAAVKKDEEEEAGKEVSRESELSIDSAPLRDFTPQRDSTPTELPRPLSGEEGETDSEGPSQQRETLPVRRLVSHEFLEMRFKIQQLLEPQQYMAFLPHHIIVQIFRFLPTETLAALKCTCHYFQFIIESYNVRPADSRWVCDPRYRDDPCKQCKKRYGRGDVSLCRWHPKPYCQALPYGPGYWMCCHSSQKDAAGCSVGLHDNRWVPAFHSLNMPIYKRVRGAEEDTS
ncbi:F-box only protein 34-like isoform X2 [Polyodon spathula]|uniref:F-box only protein 34-like isoform X2 n=1 Tax=Polyodon spathula TaxID=7913 RepID=UPI001B7DDAC4|nr:F-box only protein 34-like isoform X2 [Polyodon spathula]